MKTKALVVLVLLLSACSSRNGADPLPVRVATTEAPESAMVAGCHGPFVHGIDVSAAGQGAVNWERVHADGIEFGYAKATQGTYYIDERFSDNWSGMRDAGILRGAYHFFDPREDGADQAHDFLAKVGTLNDSDLPPALDIECPTGGSECLGFPGGSGEAPSADIYARARDFVDAVEAATHRRVLIYTFGDFFHENGIDPLALDSQPLFLADYGTDCPSAPAPWTGLRFWQYADQPIISGVSAGGLDHDYFFGTLAELKAFDPPSTPTPSPTHTPTPTPRPTATPAPDPAHFVSDGVWRAGVDINGSMIAGDFNGDGKTDLAWYEDHDGGALMVMLSEGTSFHTAEMWVSGIGKPTWFGVGDFDGDGREDVAWYDGQGRGSIRVALSSGRALHRQGIWINDMGAPTWAGVGDFNGDGKADIAWYQESTQEITMHLSDGHSFAHDGRWIGGMARPQWAGVGDFTGSRRADIAWYEERDSSIVMLTSTGTALHNDGKWLTGFGPPDRALVGDFNGDGRAAIAWYEAWNDQAVTVVLSNGHQLVDMGKWIKGLPNPSRAAAGRFLGGDRAGLAWYRTEDDHMVVYRSVR
jgi:lysozyme